MAKRTRNHFLTIALISFLALGCGNDPKVGQSGGLKTPVLSYPVLTVEKRDVTTYNQFPASLQGAVSSEVRPKVSGYIQAVLVKEGEQVKSGQPLFRIETQSLDQDASAANANVRSAQVEVDKLKPLVEKGIISAVLLETAMAKLAQAQSSYNSIKANIGYANIKSPVNGVVGSIHFRKGALASAQDQRPLTLVSSIGTVYAIFSMNEKDFINFIHLAEGSTIDEKIKNFPKVKLIMANGIEFGQEGSIETIAGDIDPQTGTLSFRARFENPAGLLRNGGSGTVLVPQIFKDVIVVPAVSTYEQQGKTFVFKVQADTLAPTSISILTEANNLYVVNQGVSVGDIILANGIGQVRSGTKIIPKSSSIDSVLNSFDPVFK